MTANVTQTSSALAGVMSLLGTHPDVLNQLTAEIRGSFSGEKDITVASLTDQRLLTAVLEESLRLFPPVSVPLARTKHEAVLMRSLGPRHPWRKVPKGSAEICGYFVPENVSLRKSCGEKPPKITNEEVCVDYGR